MAEIRLPQLGRAIECRDGENLYEVLARENLIEGPCGGRGVCGRSGAGRRLNHRAWRT